MLFWQAANQAQEETVPQQEAEQDTVWSASTDPAVEQETAWSASPHPAAEQEGATSAPPHSTAPAVISWDSFKSLAKPGDRLRLVGDSMVPAEYGNSNQTIPFGVVTPAASGMPLVTNADVAEWAADESAVQGSGHETDLAGIGNLPALDEPRTDDIAVRDDQMQWGQRLAAASSQAEKLLVLAEVTQPVIMQQNINCELIVKFWARYADTTIQTHLQPRLRLRLLYWSLYCM